MTPWGIWITTYSSTSSTRWRILMTGTFLERRSWASQSTDINQMTAVSIPPRCLQNTYNQKGSQWKWPHTVLPSRMEKWKKATVWSRDAYNPCCMIAGFRWCTGCLQSPRWSISWTTVHYIQWLVRRHTTCGVCRSRFGFICICLDGWHLCMFRMRNEEVWLMSNFRHNCCVQHID